MKRLFNLTFFLTLASISFGQSREHKFYSYLQKILNTELANNESLVIDQFSRRDEKFNWQAVIKRNQDSCIVTFLPPQYSQDTMVLPGELIIINKFKVSKTELVNAFQEAKQNLKNEKDANIFLEISITSNGKTKEFHLRKVNALYNRLRYNKSSDVSGY